MTILQHIRAESKQRARPSLHTHDGGVALRCGEEERDRARIVPRPANEAQDASFRSRGHSNRVTRAEAIEMDQAWRSE